MYWWRLPIVIGGGPPVLWLVLLIGLWVSWRHTKDRTVLRDALRLLPDVIRLLRRLAADSNVARGVRIRLWLPLAYLLIPIDLIPDFIPVLGYADDAIIIVLALRSVARHSGQDAVVRHWPGTPDGLRMVRQLAGLPVPLTRNDADQRGAIQG